MKFGKIAKFLVCRIGNKIMNEILKKDFEKIAEDYDFSSLKNKSVLVTGATGLLGSQILLFLDYMNQKENYGIKLHGLVRNKEKVSKVFAEATDENRIKFKYGDVLALPHFDCDIDYIIHGASITSSKDFINHAVETIDIAVNGTMNMLNLAKEKKVKSFVYLSSMEAFGITDGRGEVCEEDLGYIDITTPRSSYMESKRMCENLCACYTSEYGLDVKSVRLAQTLGAGIDYNDSRVAAYFARCVLEGRNIVLKTEGNTKRPIIYSSDAITAILTVLLKGKCGQTYTAANPETFTTIRETARMIVENISKNSIKLEFDIQGIPAEYAPNLNLNLNLNIDKLSSLGWKPTIGLIEAYKRLIRSMENESIDR